MNRRLLAPAAGLVIAWAAPAIAAPALDPLFADHAVVQRGQPVVVTGTAAAGATVTVTLGTASAAATAGPGGRFAATLPAMGAAQGQALTAADPTGIVRVEDVAVGDVFLCSGQSNMELTVAAAQDGWNQTNDSADPDLRLLLVEKQSATAPRTTFASVPAWQVAGPQTTGAFSAACFYMAQDLRRARGVPVGAIASSWGGTAISTWMGPRALAAAGRGADADILALYTRDPAAAAQRAGVAWEAWWRAETGDRPGAEPWQPGAALDWAVVPRVGVAWEDWGVASLAEYNGMLWYRRDVVLTRAQAARGAVLRLGAVDDMDRTWVNGIASGAGGNPGEARAYPLARRTLKAGTNTIVVNANDVWGKGGMRGPVDAMRIDFADGETVPLDDGWVWARPQRTPGNPPRVPWDDIAGAGVVNNAMIAPFGQLGLAGVAWYQGETDVGVPGYRERLAALMADWRRQLGVPDLPFAIVQLSAYGTPATSPSDSGWAIVREAQRQAVAADPHAGLAVTLDIGDPLDIHPGEKHEVGRRLARVLTALAMPGSSPAGPQIAAAAAQADGGVLLRFSGVHGALATRSADRAIAFELCDADGAACRYAPGTVAGDTVRLAGDGGPAALVRYAWADAPTVNLFDAENLPVGTFAIPVSGAPAMLSATRSGKPPAAGPGPGAAGGAR